MTASAALLVLLAVAPASGRGLAPRAARPLLHLVSPAPARVSPMVGTTRTSASTAPPPCSGDVCQPRVAVPGFEPKLSIRGKRTELVLALLDRAHVEPLATVVWAMAATGLRVDFTPASFDRGALSSGHGGWGHLQVLLRWRLDAANGPVWPHRR